ncbi:MAG: hypothetical protein ACXV0U_03595, partial [Kineosporiaceae bacterium]
MDPQPSDGAGDFRSLGDLGDLPPLLADAAGLVVRSAGRGPAPRAGARAGRIELVDLGVRQPWSVHAYVPWDAARCVADGSVSDALL